MPIDRVVSELTWIFLNETIPEVECNPRIALPLIPENIEDTVVGKPLSSHTNNGEDVDQQLTRNTSRKSKLSLFSNFFIGLRHELVISHSAKKIKNCV